MLDHDTQLAIDNIMRGLKEIATAVDSNNKILNGAITELEKRMTAVEKFLKLNDIKPEDIKDFKGHRSAVRPMDYDMDEGM